MSLDLLSRLLGRPTYELNSVLPALRALVHSQALADAVKASRNQIDDFVLAILKALIPPPPGAGEGG
jgi:hypothetical protein